MRIVWRATGNWRAARRAFFATQLKENQPSSMMNFPRRAHFPSSRMNEREAPTPINLNWTNTQERAQERSKTIWFWAFRWLSVSVFHSFLGRVEWVESAEQSQNTGNCDLVPHSFDGNGLDNRRALCFIIHIISGIIVIIGPQRFTARPRVRPWMPRGKVAFH